MPRSIASRFHPSYSKLTAFLIILLIISIHLAVRGSFTYAMPPYNPRLSYGLSTARSNLPHRSQISSFPQLAYAAPLLSLSDVPSSHFIQIAIQIFLRPNRLFIRLPSRYCSFCSFRAIAVRNPALFAFRPEAFPTNKYRLTDYS